jgi:hypothetical protein
VVRSISKPLHCRSAITLLAAALGCAAASDPQVSLEAGRFVLRGLQLPQEHWQEAFVVTVDGNPTPLLGAYQANGNAIIFVPRFPLQAGLRYRATLRAEPVVSATFEIPAVRHAPPRVERVFPSANRLPENQLKMYVHFSAPMSRGEAYRHIRLVEGDGREVDVPFLEIEQELWDPAGRRLTLLFDPGRIKRGLVPHNEVGPALKPGGRYTLVVEAGWPDATGTRAVEPFGKEFTVTEADRDPPDPSQWIIAAPRAGTRDPLVVMFPDPMDHALLCSLVTVEGVPGDVAASHNETRWSFTPEQPWEASEYRLTVDTALEDLAGNRIGRPFDVDVFERIDRRLRREVHTIPVRIQ